MSVLNPEKLHPELVFQTARSSGKGGQNVNKVESKVELRFDILASKVLTETQKEQLLQRLHNQVNNACVLVLQHQTERSQLANKEKIIKKFNQLIIKSLKPIIKRVKPPVPPVVKVIRRKEKERQSEVKEMRKKVLPS